MQVQRRGFAAGGSIRLAVPVRVQRCYSTLPVDAPAQYILWPLASVKPGVIFMGRKLRLKVPLFRPPRSLLLNEHRPISKAGPGQDQLGLSVLNSGWQRRWMLAVLFCVPVPCTFEIHALWK